MNLVGKILTVLILVMSVIFMSFAVAVYATHRNWRDEVKRPETGLAAQLQKAKADYDKLQAERDSLDARLTAEKDAAVQALAKLNDEYDTVQQELAQLRTKNDEIDLERRNALARMKTNEDELEALRKEVEGDPQSPGLRQRFVAAEQQRQKYRDDMVRLTDEKFQAVNELRRLRDYQQVLRQDLGKALAVLRLKGLEPEPELYADEPPIVDGIVEATLGDKLVEISLGSDDGLLPKHTLDVYRASTYVGRIEVVKTDPDRAVCQVIPGYLKSRVQKDDLVTSKLLR